MAVNEFSSSGKAAIHKNVHAPSTDSNTSSAALASEYSLSSCFKWITEHDFRYVALQVADTHAKLAVRFQELFEKALPERDFVILADGTDSLYCCADESTASHLDFIDAILIFGDSSCFSASRKLPVCYVIRCNTKNVDDLVRSTHMELERNSINVTRKNLLLSDQQFYYVTKRIYEDYYHQYAAAEQFQLCRMELRSSSPNVYILHNNELIVFKKENAELNNSVQMPRMPYNISILSPDTTPDIGFVQTIKSVVFIGSKTSAACFNFQLAFRHVSEFFVVDPDDELKKTFDRPVNLAADSSLLKITMRRQFFVEKLKAARIVGVLVTSTSMKTAQPLIKHTQELIANSGRFSAIFYVGKGLRGEKLANFAEVDCFINICCANAAVQLFNSASTSSSKKFFQPIVSPFDAEVAYNAHREGEQVVVETDFARLLPDGDLYKPISDTDAGDVVYSNSGVSLLSSGRSNTLINDADTSTENGLQIIPRSEALVLAKHTTNSFINSIFANRSWTGLDATPGVVEDRETGSKIALEDAQNFARLEQGRSGIAKSYANEPITR